ncbi:MAG: transposase [Lentisphaerae bacterium]|nr:transposase [Lentisphaerota bacterium]
MRRARIKESGAAYYHVISRVIERRFALDREEKERFVRLLRKVETFSGVNVITFAALDTHIHILIHVPALQDVGDEEIGRRVEALYGGGKGLRLAAQLADLRACGQAAEAEALKMQYTRRMCDLSEFMKTLKQRLTQSYNRRHKRNGTLWEDRFRSVLLDGRRGRKGYSALAVVAAYIDLNAVRAGLVSDPKDYRYCGYGEAVAGVDAARIGLKTVLKSLGTESSWAEGAAHYRRLLYARGAIKHTEPVGPVGGDACRKGIAEGGCMKGGFAPEVVQEVLRQGGKLPLPVALRCRVRYFTNSLVLGSRLYVRDVCDRHCRHLAAQRSMHPQSLRQAAWGDLWAVGRLRPAGKMVLAVT